MSQTAALERRIKRKILGVPQAALVRFPKGFGDICTAEVQAALDGMRLKAGLKPVATLTSNAVSVENCGFADLLALGLELTTAREILWIIAEGRADAAKALKARLAAVEWDLLLPEGAHLGIRVEATASRLFHEGRLRDDVAAVLAPRRITIGGAKEAEHLLDVRLKHDRLTLALSVGGRPLYQRRYKRALKGTASVKEDIAAAALRTSLMHTRKQRGADWRPREVLVPFAGSGTLGFEALLQLGRIPPALFFGPLSAESFPCAPEASLRHARKILSERWRQTVAAEPLPPVHFTEIDQDQCAALAANIAAFNERLVAEDGPAADISLEQGDVFASSRRPGPESLVALNPPYGDRLAGPDFGRLGAWLKGTGASGLALLPDPSAVETFARARGGEAPSTQSFVHGGRQILLVCF